MGSSYSKMHKTQNYNIGGLSTKISARLDYLGACNDQMKHTSLKKVPFSYLGVLYLKYQNMNNFCPARSNHLFFGDFELFIS